MFAIPSKLDLMRTLVRAYFKLFHFVTFTGHENLPPPGPALFASNHLSYYDPLLVAGGQDRPMRFMAWDALFRQPIVGSLVAAGGGFPVDPLGKDLGGFRTCLKLLKDGERVCVFPEGGRSIDGHLMPLREGIARLALLMVMPITPVRITGANLAWMRGDCGPRPWFKIGVHYCEPIHPRPTATASERRAESERIMNELKLAIDPTLQADVKAYGDA